MSNPWKDYLQNFRDNLPTSVTYREDIVRYVFNDKRFILPNDVVRYKNYLEKLGFGVTFDPDAEAYIAAVEAEAGQELSAGLREAYNGLFEREKAAGRWDAIKSMILLCGAPSLPSAMTPAKGAAMTAVNFVSDDYDPLTGLDGDGTTKFINSNRANDDDPQNSMSLWVLMAGYPTGGVAGAQSAPGATNINWQFDSMRSRSRSSTQTGLFAPGTGGASDVHFLAISRGAAGEYLMRCSGAQVTVTQDSEAPSSADLHLYGREGFGAENATPILAAGIGEHIADLAGLEASLREWRADIAEALT